MKHDINILNVLSGMYILKHVIQIKGITLFFSFFFNFERKLIMEEAIQFLQAKISDLYELLNHVAAKEYFVEGKLIVEKINSLEYAIEVLRNH